MHFALWNPETISETETAPSINDQNTLENILSFSGSSDRLQKI